MRRFTLILSDLYLPSELVAGEVVKNLPHTLALPALERLLRFSDSPALVGDWRTWLLTQLGTGQDVEWTWRATPVALEARLDHVRLVDRGLLRLDASERLSCCEEFARVFGPQYLLHDGGERTFFLSGLRPAGVHIADPARLLGCDVGPALPSREASELRRLWTEIEMWLHGSAFNTERERAGKRRVSALWLWDAASKPDPGRLSPRRADVAFFGGDPLICGLNRTMGVPELGVPGEWSQIDGTASRVVLEFAVLTGGRHESLDALDANWLAPAQAALRSGELPELELVANDHRFRIGAHSHWKVWRRPQPWLSHLRPSVRPAKA